MEFGEFLRKTAYDIGGDIATLAVPFPAVHVPGAALRARPVCGRTSVVVLSLATVHVGIAGPAEK
jgi:hypothetical protein